MTRLDITIKTDELSNVELYATVLRTAGDLNDSAATSTSLLLGDPQPGDAHPISNVAGKQIGTWQITKADGRIKVISHSQLRAAIEDALGRLGLTLNDDMATELDDYIVDLAFSLEAYDVAIVKASTASALARDEGDR